MEVNDNVEIPVNEIRSEEKLDLDKIVPVEGESVDLKKFDKKEVELIEVKVLQVQSNFTPKIGDSEKHYMQWVLKVQSEVLETLERDNEEDKIEFRASELFNLIQDKKGVLIGFPIGDGSNLMKFMKDLRIENPDKLENLTKVIEEIKGKKTLIKAYDKVKSESTKTFLKFRY